MCFKYFYHNSVFKSKIVQDQKVRLRKFDYAKYLNWILENITENDISSNRLPDSYPNAETKAPLMGTGLYCFENKVVAENYASGEVVQIEYRTDSSTLNLDDTITKFSVFQYLMSHGEEQIRKMPDKDAQDKWLILFELIKVSFKQDFENEYSTNFGIFLFFWIKILGNEPVDVIKKTFSDRINDEPFILIKNLKKINSYS